MSPPPAPFRSVSLALSLALLCALCAAAPRAQVSTATAPFLAFESGPVRPLLLLPGGQRLLVLNTADARLELFATDIDRHGVPHLRFEGAIFTGLEPVSLARHPDDPALVFVANQLSDSVSVVDLDARAVIAVIDVGDEPTDLVVADGKLFVATARSAAGGDFSFPDAWVPNAVVVAQAHAPWHILTRTDIGAHRPRGLATDGATVWVVPQNSGNRTTVLGADAAQSLGLLPLVPDSHDGDFELNPALLIPAFSQAGFLNFNFGLFGWKVPVTGRIVFDSEHPGLVPQLADRDVLELDAADGALRPGAVSGVGTTLFAVEHDAVTGRLFVAATDARNRTRFEPVLAGQALENLVSVVAPDGAVTRLVLEPPFTATPHAQPVALALSRGPAGGHLAVATLGDDSVTVLDLDTLSVVAEFGTGSLPAGLAADAERGLLYVWTRGDKRLAAHDARAGYARIGRLAQVSYDPEPPLLVAGRRQLYDARVESGAGSGNLSCASCHVFGHLDQLAWDLGDPGGGLAYFHPELLDGVLSFNGVKPTAKTSFQVHPLKGPMTTQSLRGLGAPGAAPFHWRGDRRAVQDFRGAFRSLLGGTGISAEAMQEYASFLADFHYPPNPHQPRDREYRDEAALGLEVFGLHPDLPGKEYNPAIPGTVTCADCHRADFSTGSDFTGSQVTVNFDGVSQLFNTAGLRGVHEKEFTALTGFGLLHDGSIADLRDFLDFVPTVGGPAFPALTGDEREHLVEFMRQWDSGLSPQVGRQFFASLSTGTDGLYTWLDLAESRAEEFGDADLIGRARRLGRRAGERVFGLHFTWNPQAASFEYQSDTGRWSARGPLVAAIEGGQLEVLFTSVPPGQGRRLGIDRDEDGLPDGFELDLGLNPDSADSDGDGFDDLTELLAGGNPWLPNDSLPGDTTPPVFEQSAITEAHVTTATLRVQLSKPARLEVTVTGAGAGPFVSDTLRRRHELVLSGLPAGQPLAWTAGAIDNSGNSSVASGRFATRPPQVHVAALTLEQTASAPAQLLARVTVHDQDGQPVPGMAVRGLWSGSIGSADFFPAADADGNGVVSFTLGPWNPQAGSVLTFSVAYVGSNVIGHPFYVGDGGTTPDFVYDQPANARNFVTLELR